MAQDSEQNNFSMNLGLDNFRSSFEAGEEIEGIITSITKDTIFFDVHAKSEGIIDRIELEDKGKLTVKVGDPIKAYFVRTGPGEEMLFKVKNTVENTDDEAILHALSSGIPVSGKVIGERNGGYDISLGEHDAFCPYSQIDIYNHDDKSYYIGQQYSFMVLEYQDSNLVLSRRKLLETQREKSLQQLKDSLKIGDIVDGTVKSIAKFGIFVDIGGIDGLVPHSEMSWSRLVSPDELVTVGDTISVKIIKIQWNENRITLSIREIASNDPWLTIQDRFHPTKQYEGIVTRLMEFGAFVELEPGIEGLLHISKLGAGKRLDHPSEVLKEKEKVAIYIEEIDQERRRISLSLENRQQGRTMNLEGEKLTIGETILGCVDDIKQFGIFIRLGSNNSGLLHISEIPFSGQINKIKEMYKRYPKGSEVSVIIKNIQEGKISLSLPDSKNEDNKEFEDYLETKSKVDDFGSLGSAFDNIKI